TAIATDVSLSAPKSETMAKRTASWNAPTAPGVGTATPTASTISTANVPAGARRSPKAWAIGHVVTAIDSQTAADQPRAGPRARGERNAPNPCPNAATSRVTIAPTRAGSQPVIAAAQAVTRC